MLIIEDLCLVRLSFGKRNLFLTFKISFNQIPITTFILKQINSKKRNFGTDCTSSKGYKDTTVYAL